MKKVGRVETTGDAEATVGTLAAGTANPASVDGLRRGGSLSPPCEKSMAGEEGRISEFSPKGSISRSSCDNCEKS